MLPFAPLEKYALHCVRDRGHHLGDTGQDRTLTALAEVFGTNRTTVCRWRAAGVVSDQAADRAATKLGCHPGEIWGDHWFAPVCEDAAFRILWASLDPTVMRERRAQALAESWRQRHELTQVAA